MTQTQDRLFALLATAGVVAGVVGGFSLLGSPSGQRQLRLDQRRVQDLYQIAFDLYQQGQQSIVGKKPVTLPEALDPIDRKTDPVSNQPYEYRRLSETEYELCAEFLTDSKTDRLRDPNAPDTPFWKHPAGAHCFQLEVLKEPPQPPYF